MLFQRLYWGFVCSFIVFGLFALYLNGKLLCIDSKVVEKIDMYSDGFRKESIYQCRKKKNAFTQGYFVEAASKLQNRLQKVERFLEQLEPTNSKMTLTILKDKPYFFVQKNGQVWIGEKLLLAPGHLEKAIIRNWIQERWSIHFAHQALTEEVIGDFLFHVLYGHNENADPIHQRLLKDEIQNWPQVIKSLQGYCSSPWRFSEHYEFCSNHKDESVQISAESLEFGLRPLLSQALIAAYHRLSFSERFEALSGMAKFIRMPRQPSPPIVKNAFLNFAGEEKIKAVHTMQEAAEIIRRFNLFLASSEAVKKSAALKMLVSNFNQELVSRGFEKNFQEIRFDFVFESESPISSEIIEHFVQIQSKNPTKTIALKDGRHVWMMPSRDPIPRNSFTNLQADRGIVERCTNFDFKEVMGYSENFQRLLVVGTCGERFFYHQYFRLGARGFAQQNPRASFVQLHMPSVMVKKEQLMKVEDVFDVLKNRELTDPAFQILGWQEIQWDKKINAYNPRAYVDAIEWFRDSGFRLKN